MELRINRAEIVQAIDEWADKRLRPGYSVTGVVLDKNGQGATVGTTYEPSILDELPITSTHVVELDTKVESTPTVKEAETKAKATAKRGAKK